MLVNDLVASHGIASVIEFGSGDGNQASLFDFENYTGVDVVPQVVDAARSRFRDRPSWSFATVSDHDTSLQRAELSMSLDVIYHLVEDEVYDRYMRRLTDAATKYVLVYSSDHDEELGTNFHVRHRKYSRWISENCLGLEIVEEWKHPYPKFPGSDPTQTSFAFFRLYAKSESAWA